MFAIDEPFQAVVNIFLKQPLKEGLKIEWQPCSFPILFRHLSLSFPFPPPLAHSSPPHFLCALLAILAPPLVKISIGKYLGGDEGKLQRYW